MDAQPVAVDPEWIGDGPGGPLISNEIRVAEEDADGPSTHRQQHQ